MAYTPIHLTEEDLFDRLPKNIGQVSLNYDYYSGEDVYSDGDIEDTLLNIVKNASHVEYQTIIEESNSWPILYHLSDIRGNIVNTLPITKDDKVLEIGSGCGAITGSLAKAAKSVTCVDLSARRSQINAYRNKEHDNINIYVGNFNDIEPHLDDDYDYVCLIGVFEYGASYIPTDNPYVDFLNIILKHVKKGGRAVIAIENKFGLKYWAGCTEDHNGEFYSGLEGYPKGGSARTFTRNGLEKIFKACNALEYSFYYPYPDYKLPHTIYSDKRLPKIGELTDNLRNLDRHRMLSFDEGLVFDSILEDEEFPLFSNSYLVIIGPDIDIKYTKFSNDRRPEYAIKTDILDNKVRKAPMNELAKAHLEKMASNYELLAKRYEGSGLKVNKCTFDQKDGCAYFDFEKGETLEMLMDQAVLRGDKDAFLELFDKFYELTSFNEHNIDIYDYDLIFANILVDGNDWTLIDYEWCSDEKLDAEEIAFRALYCYVLENERRNDFNMEEVVKRINITPERADRYRDKEAAFQKEVTGRHKSINEIRSTIGTYALNTKKLVANELKAILDKRIQVFYDYGQGFSEENSKYIPDIYTSDNHISVDIEFDGNVKVLRVDPADASCVVRITELVLNGNNELNNKKFVISNGKTVKNATFAFATQDPNLVFQLNEGLIKGENLLHIEMEVDRVSEELALDIVGSVRKIF